VVLVGAKAGVRKRYAVLTAVSKGFPQAWQVSVSHSAGDGNNCKKSKVGLGPSIRTLPLAGRYIVKQQQGLNQPVGGCLSRLVQIGVDQK